MTYISYPQPLSYHGQVLDNPADKKVDRNDKVELKYTDDEENYRHYMIQRLVYAKENRDRVWPELNNKTYSQRFEENEKIAHTYLEEAKNDNEKKLSTGTIESKLLTLLSHINNLNLTPEVLAFDKYQKAQVELGHAFTDIMQVTAEHDGGDEGGDKEKRIHRQLELLKQGTVFVQENWITKYGVKKKLNSKYQGEFRNFDGYTKKLEKVFEGCSREVLYGLNVYLGDMTAFSMNDQPYIFTVEQMHYDKAKALYGYFENWKYVRPGIPDSSPTDSQTNTGGRTVYDAKWRLTNIKNTHVEIIKYQDEQSNEYQIMINGVLMLPVGFPLSAVTAEGKYNITKQVLYVINPQFAMGKSFVSSGAVYELSKALDRMLRLFELKTRKSVNPPYVNTTNRVIPQRALDPGNITMGINPNALVPIGNEGQGVTASEYQIFKEIQDEIEKSTISNVFQGQQAKSGATATEVIEVQRQARLTLGLIIAACTMLEVKVGYLRLWNLLSKWLEPIGKTMDGEQLYRSVTRVTSIEGAGTGERRVVPIDGELPSPEVIRMLSLKDEQEKGYPVRRTYISPSIIQTAKLMWFVRVNPKEEESSALYKLEFREMVGDMLSLAQIGAAPNINGLQDEFSRVYNIDRNKVFAERSTTPAGNMEEVARKTSGDRAAGNNMNPAQMAQGRSLAQLKS